MPQHRTRNLDPCLPEPGYKPTTSYSLPSSAPLYFPTPFQTPHSYIIFIFLATVHVQRPRMLLEQRQLGHSTLSHGLRTSCVSSASGCNIPGSLRWHCDHAPGSPATVSREDGGTASELRHLAGLHIPVSWHC